MVGVSLFRYRDSKEASVTRAGWAWETEEGDDTDQVEQGVGEQIT